eukprot:CAMPEP_0202692490 /NCGR_PEP_ID=MMETSP1385-20130828/6852_1 /ASSEMBLY_ACC=CAM_ASM_000861 /TAXON_ID=933848 /ORGANISM="Elphidium margaritaceum" /LENGTH=251 /DNA_ID=CAMNT_0049348027 /DNA_START=65 /DNA_END=820 /DNA_ORIENTATION=+
MAQEQFYKCPKCNQEVHAVAPLSGAVCLQCNGVGHWQPTLLKVGVAMRNASSPNAMMIAAATMLKEAGIYAEFMQLYGAQLFMMQSTTNQNTSHTSHTTDNQKSQQQHTQQANRNQQEKKEESKQDQVCWTYSQTTGVLQYGQEIVANGYSGKGAGLNNPVQEHVEFVGPIPRGKYTIGASYHHKGDPPLGKVVMNLDPDNHNARGRTHFRIHGDNAKGNKSASQGCIVLSPTTVRQKIADSDCKLLLVVK